MVKCHILGHVFANFCLNTLTIFSAPESHLVKLLIQPINWCLSLSVNSLVLSHIFPNLLSLIRYFSGKLGRTSVV